MRILESRYRVEDWARGMTPFEILISTILSQSTTVANERRGLKDLRSRVGAITPERLADAPEEEIAEAIWHAGLAKQKAPRIRGVAKALLDGHGDQLERILGLPTDRAREGLMARPPWRGPHRRSSAPRRGGPSVPPARGPSASRGSVPAGRRVRRGGPLRPRGFAVPSASQDRRARSPLRFPLPERPRIVPG